ncbi:MAG: hypothetical protein V4633_10845 [Pseudomonadota bacterium]
MLILLSALANANATPPPMPERQEFYGLHIGQSGVLVVSTSNGAYRSTDGGRHWTRTFSGNSLFIVNGQAIDDSTHGVTTPVCQSRDTGLHWKCGRVDGLQAVDSTGAMYAKNEQLEISRDAGFTWRKTAPLPGMDFGAMAVHGKAIYVFWGEGILYKSTDQGAHWRIVARDLTRTLSNESIDNFRIDARGILYVLIARQMFSSRDDGRSWQRHTFGLPKKLRAISSFSVRGNTIYFQIFDENLMGYSYMFAEKGARFYRSFDGKTAEKFAIDPKYGAVDFQSAPDGSLYMVTRKAILRSSDGGKTWMALKRKEIAW